MRGMMIWDAHCHLSGVPGRTPDERLAQLIGFAGTDNVGLEGVERDYDRYICGKGGYKCIIRDAKGREIHAYDGTYIPPVDGSSVTLTIDEVIQHIAERALGMLGRC